MQNKCQICGNDCPGKRTYCKDACKQKAWRTRHPRELKFGPDDSGRNRLLQRYQFNAAKAGREWALDDTSFDVLVNGCCHYCGEPPSRLCRGFKYNGIDRKDNNLGYTVENCVSCCWDCNRGKAEKTYAYFFEWIERVARNMGLLDRPGLL